MVVACCLFWWMGPSVDYGSRYGSRYGSLRGGRDPGSGSRVRGIPQTTTTNHKPHSKIKWGRGGEGRAREGSGGV
jgi:hypothetical protein